MAKQLFSPEIRKIYAKYPALMRTATWDKIVALVGAKRTEAALELAKTTSERSKQINAQNILARKVRVNRIKLFQLQSAMVEQLKELLSTSADALELLVRRSKGTVADIKDLRKGVGSEMATLRRNLNSWMHDGVWQSILLGVRNTEVALVDVFKANEESYAPELGKERELLEERLSFGVTDKLTGSGKPQLSRDSVAYYQTTDALYEKIVQKGTTGLRPSDRIWDLTKQTELQLNRTIQREIAAGTPSRDIANDLQDYLSPDVSGGLGGNGPGVYDKPFKNAMRLARTETNRAYTNAQAEWASTRDWVKGIMVTLSSSHDPDAEGGDECDDNAGKIFDPDEFAQLVPFHPHCMCFGTIVIKDEYLDPTSAEESVHALQRG